MRTLWVVGVVLILAMMLDHSIVSAINRLCINADNSIRKLYIDGKDYTRALRRKNNVRQCDCIKIPVNSGVIAVEAWNKKNLAGIQSCNTAHPALEEEWKCRPINKAKSPSWYRPGFNDKDWKLSKGRKCNHCRRYYKLPCRLSDSKCYWSNKQSKIVRCRIKQCADGCTGCKKAGYGKCDPDKCMYGFGENAFRNNTLCNRQCRLKVKAWKSATDATGYIRVTDVLSGYTDTLTADVTGVYYATVDMTTCTVTNKRFAVFEEAAQKITIDVFNQWNSATAAGANFKNVVGIELAVGPDDDTIPWYYGPWISIARLGLGTAPPVYTDGRSLGYSATLTGVQYGVVEATDVQTIPNTP